MRSLFLVPVLAIVIVAPTFAADPHASDWPQWRGPERDGHVHGFSSPDTWPEQLRKVWSVEVGPGLSSPVVGDGRAYLLTRDGEDEVVAAYDLGDGARVWRQTYPSLFYANGGAQNPRFYPESKGKGPFATPLWTDSRLYTLGVNRVLSSFDARTGELAWRQKYLPVELPENVRYVCTPCGCADDGKTFDAPGPCPSCGMGLTPEGIETSAKRGGGNYYGATASPLVVGKLGVVHVGNPETGVMIAFDRKTGKERWRREGPVIGYASPIVATLGGERQLVTITREAVIGVAAKTGEPRWSFPLDTNAHVITPVVLDDLVITAQYRGPTFALRVTRDGDDWTAEQAWENSERTQWMSSPVLEDGRLVGFFFSNKGQFAVLDARTGAALWEGEGRQGEGATVVVSGDDVIGLKNDGTLVVFHESPPGLTHVRDYTVADSQVWTYPVLFGKNILVKEATRLTLWAVD